MRAIIVRVRKLPNSEDFSPIFVRATLHSGKTKRVELVDPTDASTALTAAVLGLTRQRISQLRNVGVLNTNGKRGRYDLTEVVPDYVNYLRGLRGSDVGTRLIKERTRKLRIQNDRQEANLVDVQDVKTIFSFVCNEVVGRLTEIPGRIAPELAGTSSPRQVRVLLEREFESYRSWLEKMLTEVTNLVDAD